jgi:hypothetical protein
MRVLTNLAPLAPPILLVESASVEDAKKALAKLPLVAQNLIDLDLIPLAPFTGFAHLFQATN